MDTTIENAVVRVYTKQDATCLQIVNLYRIQRIIIIFESNVALAHTLRYTPQTTCTNILAEYKHTKGMKEKNRKKSI